MAFAPPRKPPSSSRIPSTIRQTTSIRSVTSTSMTSIPRSTASSSRTGSCGTGAPCGSSRSGIRPPSTSRGSISGRPSTGPSMIETTSSTIIEPGRTTTTRTERRVGAAARPLTTPQAGIPASRYRPQREVKSSGYGMQPRRSSGVCPGASGTRRAASARGTMETVTSTSSMTIDPDGTETLVEEEQRIIQPAAGPRAAGVCPGAQQAPARRARVTEPPPSERPSMGRTSLGGRPSIGGRPSVGGGPSISRTAPRAMSTPAPSMQKATTRTSRTTFADGREITDKSSRTERVPPQRSSGYGPQRRIPAAAPSAVSSTSVTSTVSTGAIPKIKILTTRASKTSVKGTKKTTTVQEVTKTTPAVLPEGRYALSLKHAPHTKEGRLQKFSSPPELRHAMDRNIPEGIKMMPPEFRGIQDVRKLKAYEPYKDVVSLAMNISRPRRTGPPGYYADPHEYSFLESGIEPEEGEYTPPGAAALDEPTILEQEVGETLVHTAMQSPGKGVKVSGSRKSPARPHVIITDQGPVMATGMVISEKKVEKIPGAEKISRHITGIEPAASLPSGMMQMELTTQEIEPSGGLPAKSDTAIETVSVRSAVAVAPGGVKESTTTVIYETTKPPRTPPRSPLLNISPEEVERMVEEEAIDVNKTLRLKPLDLKVFSPKSYPTRKREQELKLTYTSVVELEQSVIAPELSPDQEQEEVQPEMMATIMFTEESKLGLESQPAEMYDLLFPEKRDATMMTVNSVAPAPLQDILVPHQLPENFHAKGATPEIQTAISTVEVKGDSKPSGSAFCEAAGDQTKIKNTARRKKKKLTDVPLLAEEMPPWGVEDMEPLVEAVGAPLRTSLIATVSRTGDEEEGEAPPPPPEEEDVAIDYMLQLEPPTHISRVQLRGSTRPPWFGGYYVALPEIPNLVRVEMTAESALVSAWRAMQPNLFPDDSIITV